MTHDEMSALTEGHRSKSAKIRRLAAAGVAKTEIAKFLGIRYQFVYNVLAAPAPSRQPASPRSSPSANRPAAFEPTLEDFIRHAHTKGFAVTFHPLRGE